MNGVLSARKAIAIELEAPVSIPEIALDRGKIEQVLNNLIGNAVKFSHRGRAVHVSIAAADGVATVAVRDQGQGIPEADLSSALTEDRARCLAAGMDDCVTKPMRQETLRDLLARWLGPDVKKQ